MGVRSLLFVEPILLPDDVILKIRTERRHHEWGCGPWRASCVIVGPEGTNRWAWTLWSVLEPSGAVTREAARFYTAEAQVLAAMRLATGVNMVRGSVSARYQFRSRPPDHPFQPSSLHRTGLSGSLKP